MVSNWFGFSFLTTLETPLYHPISHNSLARVFPRFPSSQLHIFAWAFDWFTVLCVSFVITRVIALVVLLM